jgi:hypothetical protein
MGLGLGQRAEQAEVGDQEAADPFLGGPQHVLQRVGDLPQPADLVTLGPSVLGPGVRPHPVPLPRPDEQAHLDAGLQAGLGHITQFGGPQQHRAAALGDPVDRDALGLGGPQHRLQHPRPLHAGDLDAEGGAVGERGVVVRAGDAKPAEHVLHPAHRCPRLLEKIFDSERTGFSAVPKRSPYTRISGETMTRQPMLICQDHMIPVHIAVTWAY